MTSTAIFYHGSADTRPRIDALEEYRLSRLAHNEPVDIVRAQKMRMLLHQANRLDAGDYLELGVFRGITARLIWRLMDRTRELFLLDTFEGFTQEHIEAETAFDPNTKWHVGNFATTSPERVLEFLGNPQNVTVIKGQFPKTFAHIADKKWRFIHLDMDLYEPTRAAVELCWLNLLPGGVMLFHDYRYPGTPGVRWVVDALCETMEIEPTFWDDRYGSAVVVKP